MDGTRPLVVHHGEVDELLVDEVRVRDLRHCVVHEQVVLWRVWGFRTGDRESVDEVKALEPSLPLNRLYS